MATGLQVIGRFAPLLGLLPSTLERQLRAQRLAGQLPSGRPGGGKFSAHFEAGHLANVILGLAGSEPSDAPDAAVRLRLMPLQDIVNPPPGVPPPLPTLEDQLADWLAVIAEAYRRGGRALAEIIGAFQSWEMSLCLSPRRVVIQQTDVQRAIVYASEDAEFALRRVTVLRGNLMVAAGELLADTIERTKVQPAMAGAEQESAETLPGAPAPFSDQPRTHGTDRTSSTQDGIRGKNEFQARPVTPTATWSDDRCPIPTILMT